MKKMSNYYTDDGDEFKVVQIAGLIARRFYAIVKLETRYTEINTALLGLV